VHGHGKVPSASTEIPSLGRWVTGQRTEYRRGQLPPEQEVLLNKIGFQWRIYKKGGR
jgi:hypothetical protein